MMSDLDHLLTVISRQSLLDWTHGLLGGALLTAWAICIFGGPV